MKFFLNNDEKPPKFKNTFLFVLFSLICLAGIGLSFMLGQVSVPFNELTGFVLYGSEKMNPAYYAILKSRLTRCAVAFITGGGLAMAGVIYQSALKNHLADPFMLGVSAGAALFSALAITLQFKTSFMISVFAFSGAMISVGTVILISGLRKFASYNLILGGTALNSFFSSFLTVVMYLSKDMQNIFFWLMGSLDVLYTDQIVYTYVIVIVSGLYVYRHSRILDILKFNEKTVFALGIDETRWKIKFLLIASVISSIIVSQTGIIGFVGLIVPHAARIIIGDLHGRLIPFSFLVGGVMMIYCDIISRTMVDSMNFPIGAVTSLVGAPFFIILLSGAARGGDRR